MTQDQVDITLQNEIFVLTGELSFSNVMSLYQKSLFQFEKTTQLIIDFAKVKSINSIGLALVIEWINYAKSRNKTIKFQNISTDLLAIAKAAGVDTLITVV